MHANALLIFNYEKGGTLLKAIYTFLEELGYEICSPEIFLVSTGNPPVFNGRQK